jgi:hypothetical protein
MRRIMSKRGGSTPLPWSWKLDSLQESARRQCATPTHTRMKLGGRSRRLLCQWSLYTEPQKRRLTAGKSSLRRVLASNTGRWNAAGQYVQFFSCEFIKPRLSIDAPISISSSQCAERKHGRLLSPTPMQVGTGISLTAYSATVLIALAMTAFLAALQGHG